MGVCNRRSCAYATPIGMPANTMVVGAEDIHLWNYVKAGFPLIIIATVVSMIILPIAFPFFRKEKIVFIGNDLNETYTLLYKSCIYKF